MKFSLVSVLFFLASSAIAAPPVTNVQDISVREVSPLEQYSPLEKRKGGGGGKGGGGKGGSTGGGSGGRPSSSYSFSPQSSLGGRTISGSGPKPAFGNRYTGGAVVPYTAGGRSPTRGLLPFAFPLVIGLAIFPGLWLYGSLYAYPYPIGYNYLFNGQNRTSNVTCLCQRYQVCGCDPSDNSTFLRQQLANGVVNGPPINSSTVRTVEYANGSIFSYINGSLPNGTTAPGGTDPSNESQISAAMRLVMGYAGYSVMAATVILGVTLM
jgi:hypothetical protein